MFSKLCVLHPGFSIGLFATALNAQLHVPRFSSWKPDPRATFVDAFGRSWHSEFFYTFPHFSLIQRCLDKVEMDQAQSSVGSSLAHSDTVHSSCVNVNRADSVDGVDFDDCSNPPIRPQNAQHAGSSHFDGMSCVRQFYRGAGLF